MEKAREYALLSAKIDELKAKQDALRIEILSEMEESGSVKVDTEYGKFTHAKRTTWTYSDNIAAMQEKVKVAQVKEQQQGIAEKHQTDYLLFTKLKKK